MDARRAGQGWRRPIPLPSPAIVAAVLAAAVMVVLATALTGARSRPPPDPWACRSVSVTDGTATGSTAREALDRYIATGAVPGDLWGASEPNRFTRSRDGIQMVVNVYQQDESTWSVTRADVCGR